MNRKINHANVKYVFWCFPPISYDKSGKRESDKIKEFTIDQIANQSLRMGCVENNLNNCFDK